MPRVCQCARRSQNRRRADRAGVGARPGFHRFSRDPAIHARRATLSDGSPLARHAARHRGRLPLRASARHAAATGADTARRRQQRRPRQPLHRLQRRRAGCLQHHDCARRLAAGRDADEREPVQHRLGQRRRVRDPSDRRGMVRRVAVAVDHREHEERRRAEAHDRHRVRSRDRRDAGAQRAAGRELHAAALRVGVPEGRDRSVPGIGAALLPVCERVQRPDRR